MNDQKPNISAQRTNGDSDKAAYEAKQAKDVKESVNKCRSDSEFYNTVKQVKEDRQKNADSKTQGEDNDHYNGMSQ